TPVLLSSPLPTPWPPLLLIGRSRHRELRQLLGRAAEHYPIAEMLPLRCGRCTRSMTGPAELLPDTCVTWPEISQWFQGPATPRKRSLPPEIVPDGKWPGMYRLRLPNGRLSDMVNLTRAIDAVNAAEGKP